MDRYFCNFSVFQSLPDNWAIDQLFPIMPIHRLLEPPSRRGTLQDMTCDSDGVIDRFAGGRKGKPSLELHPVPEGEPYILGIFLTGAYQEILGDLHNLFGDTNAVHVRLTEQGYEITDLVHGDTVTEVLNYVQFHASDLLATFRRKVANAKDLTRQEANSFIADFVAGLEGYTYLEGDVRRAVRVYRLLRLVHLLQLAHHVRIRQRRGVAQRAAFGDVLEQPAHDLAAPGLGQVGREEDVVRPGDGADLLGHVRLEVVLERGGEPCWPSLRVTNAASAWPLSSCARPTTAASATAGWSTSALSTSIVPIRCPATLSTSSTRPRIHQ